MNTIIDELAKSSALRRQLRVDPLRLARIRGYVVTDKDVQLLLSPGDAPGEDVLHLLRILLSRFDEGKWYEATPTDGPIPGMDG